MSPRLSLAATFLFLGATTCLGQSNDLPSAEQIFAATGIQGGLVVHLGSGDGQLTASLRANDRYIVHGLDRDRANVDRARQHIRSIGIYGPASAEVWSGNRLPYADNTVNLIVAESTDGIATDELMRVLCPEGVLYSRSDQSWKTTVKPRPTTIDEWTHFMHAPDNNAVAKDSVVGPPEHLQWVGGPKWARGHEVLATISVAVTAGGRIFYVADEGPTASVNLPSKWMLVARDAFNGVLLWKREIEKWESRFRPFRSGPTHLPRRLVAIDDEVFMTLGFGEPLSVLDAATGEIVRVYEGTEGTEEVLIENGRLHLVVGDPKDQEAADQAVRRGKSQPPVHKEITVLDLKSGAELWRKADNDTADLFAQTLAISGDRAFFQNTRAVVALNVKTGEQLWRTPRSASVKRPAWSVPSLVVDDGVVFSADRKAPEEPITSEEPQRVEWEVTFKGGNAPMGELVALSAESGERLWSTECQEGYNAPVDVILTDGQLWTGNVVKSRDPGITKARDPKTGEVTRTRPSDLEFFSPGMSHHRCYRNRATEKFILLGRSGVELVDVKTGKAVANHWVRGTCQLGVIPANGLIYVPPHTCACYIKTKLNGFNALASKRPSFDPNPLPEPQLVKGPAFGRVSGGGDYANEWPTYRHDARRSGSTSISIPTDLQPAWSADIGGRLTGVVVADDKAFVASVHQHAVHAVNVSDGTSAWTFTAGGRVDSAPTAYNGMVLFGSTDGYVYCLRSSDGELVWKFRGGPEDRRIVVDGALESSWPVHGSVLVMNDLVYFTAGRSSYLDGGMRMYSLKADTGEIVSSNRISGRDPETGEQPKSAVKGFDMDSGLPDVLSSDGEFVFMRDMKFDEQCSRQLEGGNHLFSPTGFLDDSWWHRSYWLWAPEFKAGWGGWHQAGNTYPAGRILCFTDEAIYGFGRNEMTKGNGGQWNNGEYYRLFGAQLSLKEAAVDKPKPGQKRRGRAYPKSRVEYLWQERIEPEVRAMVLARNALFVAGPHGETHLSLDAFEGREGKSLQAISLTDGKPISSLELDELPIFDGMAAATGRLFLAMKDGTLKCFSQ